MFGRKRNHMSVAAATAALAGNRRAGRFGSTMLDMLAAICGRGIPHYTKDFDSPRDWIEWQVRGRCCRPTPRQSVGGQRYDVLERRRAIARKRRGPNYAKQAQRAYRTFARFASAPCVDLYVDRATGRLVASDGRLI